MIAHHDIPDGEWYSKVHKMWPYPDSCLPCNALLHPCRKAVSGNKKRFQKYGYDLDLVYLTKRIIVHGFPAIGMEHIYRNPRTEMKRFLEEFHPQRYKIFNFCCEPGRGYDPGVFDGRVERYPFRDHSCPTLETMIMFAESAKSWLDVDDSNVVALHCKAGKGRAGIMACILLLRLGEFDNADTAMEIYDARRVENNKGLTVTSQRKCVHFYEIMWRYFWNIKGSIGDFATIPHSCPPQPELRLCYVDLLVAPALQAVFEGAFIKVLQCPRLSLSVTFKDETLFDSRSTDNTISELGVRDLNDHPSIVDKCFRLSWPLACAIQGNFKVQVLKMTSIKCVPICELSHNTLCMDRFAAAVEFGADQMDFKGRSARALLASGFKIRLRFRGVRDDIDHDIDGLRPGGNDGDSVTPGEKHVDPRDEQIMLDKSSQLAGPELWAAQAAATTSSGDHSSSGNGSRSSTDFVRIEKMHVFEKTDNVDVVARMTEGGGCADIDFAEMWRYELGKLSEWFQWLTGTPVAPLSNEQPDPASPLPAAGPPDAEVAFPGDRSGSDGSKITSSGMSSSSLDGAEDDDPLLSASSMR